jgi:multidrug transporter EmrE-like cation transporter
MLSMLLAFCIIFDVARDLCFKLSARAGIEAVPTSFPHNFFGLFAPHTVWAAAGAAVWGIEILAYAQVLARLPLNIAFPIMSLTYAAAPLAGWLLLGEKVSPQRWFGIGLVTAGVMIIGTTGIS